MSESNVQQVLQASQEADIHVRRNVLFKTEIVAGLRFSQATIAQIFTEVLKVLDLRESETYQMILEEGRQEGRQEGWQEGRQEGRQEGIVKFQSKILEILRKRFGSLPLVVADEIKKWNDLDRLDLALSNALECQSLEEFLKTLG